MSLETNKKQTTVFKSNTQQLTMIGIMAAVTCILGPLSVPMPVSPVPITLTNLAIYLSAYLLGAKRATISYFIYLLLGLAGLPVFSGFMGGPQRLFGKTGGYLIGFLFMAYISGFFIERFYGKLFFTVSGLVLGTLVTYLLGTLWLSFQTNLPFLQALFLGVIPYLLGDGLKIAIASLLGPVIRKRLLEANLL